MKKQLKKLQLKKSVIQSLQLAKEIKGKGPGYSYLNTQVVCCKKKDNE